MSLINDALKKAQRQRTGDSPPSQPPLPGGPSAPRSTRGGSGLNPQLLLLGIGALLGLFIATGAVFFFRHDRQPEPAATVATAPRASDRSEPRPTEIPTVSAPASAAPTPAPSVARTPSSTVAQAAEPTVVVKAEPAATAPVVPPPASSAPTSTATDAPAPSAASGPAAPSLRMIEAIEAFRVAGIRAGTGTDAKVLMNDRVYRIGDTVDHALGLKLTGVTANSLTFRDATGATYTRNF